MKIDAIIISEFRAKINNIEFKNKDLYYCIYNTLSHINERFNVNLKDEFLLDLINAITAIHKENSSLSYDEIYNLFVLSFYGETHFHKLRMRCYFELPAVKRLNNKIKAKYYLINK